MAETIVLEATRRDVLGKQVKQLRAKGLIPGSLYGPTFESLSIQMDWLKLRPVLVQAGGTHLIQLDIDGESYNALVRRVDRDPLRGEVLHVDFYRVRMDVVIRTEVPLVLVGDELAFEKIGGAIRRELNAIEIECLPGNLPAEIRVDISGLHEIGETIVASALPEIPGVKYHIDPDIVVVSTGYLSQLEVEEPGEGEAAEPELIRRRPADEDEEV